MDSTLVESLIGPVAVLVGIAVSEALFYWRQKRQKRDERKELAGALAAELRGLLAHLQEIAPSENSPPFAMVWAAESSYFPVFDSIGPKLLVLPAKLAEDVVACYVRCKSALDKYRLACRLGEYEAQATKEEKGRWGLMMAQWHASGRAQAAAEYAAALTKSLQDDLLPRLDNVAKGGSRKS